MKICHRNMVIFFHHTRTSQPFWFLMHRCTSIKQTNIYPRKNELSQKKLTHLLLNNKYSSAEERAISKRNPTYGKDSSVRVMRNVIKVMANTSRLNVYCVPALNNLCMCYWRKCGMINFSVWRKHLNIYLCRFKAVFSPACKCWFACI